MLILMRMRAAWAIFVWACLVAAATEPCSAVESSTSIYTVRSERWTAEDEIGFQRFIQAIGESECSSLNECLHSAANPFRDTDPPLHRFESDCADLPYVLRFYYAWKRGLPFSYVNGIAPRDGQSDDIRYSRNGNKVESRKDVPGGVLSGYAIIEKLRAAVNSGTYRMHPDADSPLAPDFYSPSITPSAIHPGTVIYDPAGHVAIVYRVDPDGRVHAFDAHTDYSLTQLVFDVRFARTRPAQGAGFKNWRPIRLVGATKQADSSYTGGHIEVARNSDIPDFSDEQYYGTGKRPRDADWTSATFAVGGETMGYYDFIRARLAGGQLVFSPIKELREMVWNICSDLQYRAQAVELARSMASEPHPPRLPRNIYGTSGDWEMYSTPSRDARLKTAFKNLRDTAQRFVELYRHKDAKHLSYAGSDLPADLLKTYVSATSFCHIQYRRSDGSLQPLSFEEARQRLFAMSFDPYHCPERRWGASDATELSTCRDGETKHAWYDAEQSLRNQIERTYDARMDFSLDELRSKRPGAEAPPDTDVRGYLEGITKQASN